MTYRNSVKGKDEKRIPETWLFTWADTWVKEDGEWKVAAIYAIDSKKLGGWLAVFTAKKQALHLCWNNKHKQSWSFARNREAEQPNGREAKTATL